MWYKLYSVLYILTNNYGKKYGGYSNTYSQVETSPWAYIILTGFVGLFIGGMVYLSWDVLADWWAQIRNRHKIKTITIKVAGRDMSPHKLDKLTDDVNEILSGKGLPQILDSHNLSATDIIGMSAVPQHDCFLFTVWYK